MEKIRINKKIFISRPMNGVTRDEDNKLLKEIRETLIKEQILGNSVNAEVVNTWLGTIVPDDISDEQARLWRLGHAISEMATADVLIFVGGLSGARGCHVEFEVYNRYKDVMQKQWKDVLVYYPKKKTLSHLHNTSEVFKRYLWTSEKCWCIDDVAYLISDLTTHGYPNELIEDAVNLSKKILDVGRTNM